MTIGERLTKARGARSREEVAFNVGVSVSAISNYENDARVPRDQVKIRLARYYGTTVQDLFFPQ